MENKIPLKTDGAYFNPHDFIQTECGTMKELLVTTTLAEYRSLVETNARLYARIGTLEDELKKAMMEAAAAEFAAEKWEKENADAAG